MDHPDKSGPSLNRRRFLAASATAAAGTAALVAPGAVRRTFAAPARDTTTLTVMYAANELTPAYIKQFEGMNPDIKIRFVVYNQTTLNSMVAAGKPPDLFRQGAVGSVPYTLQGVNEDLTPYLAKSTVLKQSDLLAVNNLFRWDGKQQGKGPIYGIVKDWSLDYTLWANDKLLSAAGYKHIGENQPLSYEDILAMGKKMTVKKSGQTAVYGYDLAWGWSQHFTILQIMAKAAGSSLFSADLKKSNFTSPEVLKALQWLVDYCQAGVGTSPLLTDATSPTAPFVAGRTALSSIGYWFGEQVETDPHHLSSYMYNVPAPSWQGVRVSPCGAGIGISMAAKSQNKDAAWKLIEYFMAGQPAIDRAKGGWGLASLKSMQRYLPQATAFDKERYRVTQNDLKHFASLPLTPYADFTAMATAVTTELTKVLKGNQTLTTAAKNVEQTIDKLIAQTIAATS
jgi:multiple sugar transport system substrate-binding protein